MGIIVGWVLHFGIVELFLVGFTLVNVLTFALYAIDKRRAAKDKRRIRERTLLLFTLACGGIGALFGMYLMRHKTRKIKFRAVLALGLVIALIPIIHIAHSLALDRVIHYAELTFRTENWPPALDGYRIAFMTDMHIIPDEDIWVVAAELDERDIDLLLLGGDFSMRNAHYQGTVREIAQIRTTDGIFGVEGNHDNYQRLFRAMEQHGITPLDNSGIQVRDGFYLAGVQDLWNRTPDIQAAIGGANADDFVLLITHNPDVSMQQSTAGVDLILAGHTHGGQITLFGFPLYLLRGSITDYGTRFAHGFAESTDAVPIFTSRGVGVYYTIPRIFARPEVVIFTMYSG